ncbi:hypothetical protein NPX13_g6095 [Xylaria arbuscula]|uniref:Uncharacterized protein n=1 Tax=Xylaria arbuscula TaxID=114810 RepID=A0A9W8TKF4_9PEZI|nr:hypothetical protein NPX13_g6095 [Xylaria arbuscula]
MISIRGSMLNGRRAMKEEREQGEHLCDEGKRGSGDGVVETLLPAFGEYSRGMNAPETYTPLPPPAPPPTDDYLYEASKLQFGVETEIPLAVTTWNEHTGKQEPIKNYMDAAGEIARLFSNKGYDATSAWPSGVRNYRCWFSTIDSSIDAAEDFVDEVSPCEIVSPIMDISVPTYKNQFQDMWEIIQPFMLPNSPQNTEYWKLASTHIHFSLPEHIRFPIELAQKIAFCAIYFERAIDDLMPTMTDQYDSKRINGWKGPSSYCRRNRVKPGCRPMHAWTDESVVDDLTSCWLSIRHCNSMPELAAVMCHNSWAQWNVTGGVTKYYKWNFTGIGYRTIEFRQMPPCRSYVETLGWIRFVCAFVAAAECVSTIKLDQAAVKKITFAKALGVKRKLPDDAISLEEKTWCSDASTHELTRWHLFRYIEKHAKALFDDFGPHFWFNLVFLKERIERDLARCGAQRVNSLAYRVQAWHLGTAEAERVPQTRDEEYEQEDFLQREPSDG